MSRQCKRSQRKKSKLGSLTRPESISSYNFDNMKKKWQINKVKKQNDTNPSSLMQNLHIAMTSR
jgi:hypothetical protein